VSEEKIAKILIYHGEKLFNSRKDVVSFTGNSEVNDLLNDLTHHPHAFVLACIANRQVKAEIAWNTPFKLKQELGDFSLPTLAALSDENFKILMKKQKPRHRFHSEMSSNFYQAIQKIDTVYDRDASEIWANKPPSAQVVYQFLQFKGIGPKIATMAANILARDFKIEFRDYFSIDISADVHIRRVFTRLGLVQNKASVEEIIYKARTLHPEFPGIMDLPVWEIGRYFCKAKTPSCESCYMKDVCNHAGGYK
jgi:endonuclease III